MASPRLDTYWTEQLRPRLEGQSDDEYFREPVPGCWTVRRRAEPAVGLGSGEFTRDVAPPTGGPEPVTTIAWRLGHLAAGLAEMSGTWFGGPRVSAADYAYACSAAQALAQLDQAYAAWIRGVRGLGAGLAEPQGHRSPPEFADAPVARLVLYTSVEVFHHGAEICLLRDLHLGRAG